MKAPNFSKALSMFFSTSVPLNGPMPPRMNDRAMSSERESLSSGTLRFGSFFR